MSYCIEKGIECNNADYQGWCNYTRSCDKTISGGKGNSITYTIKHDNTAAMWNTINGCSISNTKQIEDKLNLLQRIKDIVAAQEASEGTNIEYTPEEAFYCIKELLGDDN